MFVFLDLSSNGNLEMVSDLDTYRTANLLIKRYGNDASIEASLKADEMLENGDLDGQRVWIRVLGAIEEIQSSERPKGTTLN